MRKKLSDMTKQYSSFFLCVILCCLAAEFIGPIKLSLGRFTVTFLPLLYAMLLMLVLYLAKPVRGVGKAYVPAASRMLSMGVVFAMAKLGISSGASIKEMISASPILILQNIGNIGTVLFALPIALILGMKREAVGMSYALSREPNVALIADMYGSESDEFKGVMVCYIVGTVFGSIFMSVIPPLFVTLGIFRPEAAAMAVGAGSSSHDGARTGRCDRSIPCQQSRHADSLCNHQQCYLICNHSLPWDLYNHPAEQPDL